MNTTNDLAVTSGVTLLICIIHQHKYALPVAAVHKIISAPVLLPINDPVAPDYLCGLLELQGRFLLCLDVAKRLGLSAGQEQMEQNALRQEQKAADIIIVVEWQDHWLGLLVDHVLDVITVGQEQLTPLPEYTSAAEELPASQRSTQFQPARFITAIFRSATTPIMVLDLAHLAGAILPVLVKERSSQGQENAVHRAPGSDLSLLAPEPTAPSSILSGAFSQTLVLFRWESEYYAFPLEYIRQFLHGTSITPVPGVPAFVTGVANYRGNLLTVIDARQFLGLPTRRTGVIIVVEMDSVTVGLLVDEVLEIIALSEQLHASRHWREEERAYLQGELLYNNRIVGLINLPNLLSEERLVV